MRILSCYKILGQSATFTVAVVGEDPLNYQWRFNGAAINNATNASHTIPSVQGIDQGDYTVVVTNAWGAVTSAVATLSVISCPDIVAWWPVNGNALDVIGGNSGNIIGGLTFVQSLAGEAFGGFGSNAYITVSHSASIDLGAAAGMTIEAWINTTNSATAQTIVERQRAGMYGTHLDLYGGDGVLHANLVEAGGGWRQLYSTTGKITGGTYHHVVLTYDKSTGLGCLYADGVLAALDNLGSFQPYTSEQLFIGSPSVMRGISPFIGAIDELAFYNRALAATEIDVLYQAGPAGKCRSSAPVITIQPQSQTVFVGQSVGFTVSALGSAPLSYQWFHDGVQVEGATNVGYTIASVQTTNQGDYTVMVSSFWGAVTSAIAHLTVVFPPLITQQPASLTITQGQTATFTVLAMGNNLCYQWGFNGASVAQATNSTYTITNAQSSDAGIYSCVLRFARGAIQHCDQRRGMLRVAVHALVT